MNFDTISVIGLGYIGLPTAAILASRKIRVIGVDISKEAVDTINQGKIHIVEPELDIAVKAVVTEGYLQATTTPAAADAFLIAVPTPFKGAQHEPDLAYISAASKSIAPVLKKGDLVILESTAPVGTTEEMASWLSEARPDLTFPQTHGEDSDIRIAYCPERVLPGQVIRELIQNDRVIGGMTPKCSEAACTLYQLFVQGKCVTTNSRTAEMCKLTENSFRDVNIAFANELSIICDKSGINVWELIDLANLHPRVNILQPGPGVGGHCIAVDPWFIVNKNPEIAKLISTARKVNDFKPDWVANKIQEAVNSLIESGQKNSEEDITIACYGLAFKANIDDLRESPAMSVVRKIMSRSSCKLLAVEPNISHLDITTDKVVLCDFENASKNADIHVLLVDHSSFKTTSAPKGILIDTKGVWEACGQSQD